MLLGSAVHFPRSPASASHVKDIRTWRTIGVERRPRVVLILSQVHLHGVLMLGGVGAIQARVLIDVRVRLQVAIQHGLVDATVGALLALERLVLGVILHVVVHVMLELGDELARRERTAQPLLRGDVKVQVLPPLVLHLRLVVALLALVRLLVMLRGRKIFENKFLVFEDKRCCALGLLVPLRILTRF